MEQKLVFGEKIVNLDYQTRKGCYAVIFDAAKQKVAAVLTSRGHYFLPGGGMEHPETPEDCLRRELLEETGYEINICCKIGEAERYFVTVQNEPLLNDAHFYLAELTNKVQEPVEDDHELVWIHINDAGRLLFHDHHAWAVNKGAGLDCAETELLKIFDENRKPVGVATREEVHKYGYWHETFHCWFTGKENGVNYIYFQIRSAVKKDYPNLLDITAAGHILAHETVCDGIREVKEEVGIEVAFEELASLGVVDYCVTRANFIDKELANVFLYRRSPSFDKFQLQQEEVSGIVRAEFRDFSQLCSGQTDRISVEGFEINAVGNRDPITLLVGKSSFVPHEESYYKTIIKWISELIGD